MFVDMYQRLSVCVFYVLAISFHLCYIFSYPPSLSLIIIHYHLCLLVSRSLSYPLVIFLSIRYGLFHSTEYMKESSYFLFQRAEIRTNAIQVPITITKKEIPNILYTCYFKSESRSHIRDGISYSPPSETLDLRDSSRPRRGDLNVGQPGSRVTELR